MNRTQKQHADWLREHFPGARPTDCLLKVFEEVGELARAHYDRSPGAERDAIGDVLLSLFGFCTLRGWDVDNILGETWQQVRQRKPKRWRGSISGS